MNIVEMLRVQSRTRPDGVAIIDTGRGRSHVLTFSELARAAAQAAALMRRCGLEPGDAVLVLHPMSAELYVALLALFRLGLVAMFPDPSAGREHIDHCCSLYPPKAWIGSSRAHILRFLSPALRRIPRKFAIGPAVPGATSWSRARSLAPHEEIHTCTAETPALLTFTSGSTGRPKAALRTHGFLLAQHRVLEESLGLAPGEVDLTTLPIFALTNLASGSASFIPDADLRRPGFIDPAPLVAQILAHRPTRAVASPALFDSVADFCLRRGVTLPSLKKVFSGGAPVFPGLLSKLQSIAPQAEIIAVYGSTEAEPMSCIAWSAMEPEDTTAMLDGQGLLVGSPVRAIQLRTVRDQWGRPIGPFTRSEFAAACLPPGVVGEIVVTGEHVLSGYLNGDADGETKFAVDGTRWHRTGDAGYLDGRGRLWLLGRCAARVEDSRGTLYPLAVECSVHQHPGVRRAAVASHHGRRILIVQLREGETNADLARLKQRLAWAHIDDVRIHESIPVDNRHNAKIDYTALSRVVSGGFDRLTAPSPSKTAVRQN